MLTGGLAGIAIMLGTGAIMVSNAPPAGPGQEATWPASETMSLDRTPNKRNSGNPTATCTLTPEGQPAEQNRRYTIGDPTQPDFTGVPLLITTLGILFFFPRFTHTWARLPTQGWLRKMLRLPPPH
jgi:hypothetical protein